MMDSEDVVEPKAPYRVIMTIKRGIVTPTVALVCSKHGVVAYSAFTYADAHRYLMDASVKHLEKVHPRRAAVGASYREWVNYA